MRILLRIPMILATLAAIAWAAWMDLRGLKHPWEDDIVDEVSR